MTHRPSPAAANDPALLHSSTMTTLSTNRDVATWRSRVMFRVTKLEIRVLDDEVVMRFTANELDVTPGATPARRERSTPSNTIEITSSPSRSPSRRLGSRGAAAHPKARPGE
jgi:hypothetical protein